ncbi:hypothetical protein [Streptomyces sp. NPDC020330]
MTRAPEGEQSISGFGFRSVRRPDIFASLLGTRMAYRSQEESWPD